MKTTIHGNPRNPVAVIRLSEGESAMLLHLSVFQHYEQTIGFHGGFSASTDEGSDCTRNGVGSNHTAQLAKPAARR